MTLAIETHTIIDDTYRVEDVCNESGGMGTLVFVTRVDQLDPFPLVMKYCREDDDEPLARFKREVRLLQDFNGNSRVVEIVDANLNHIPPYYIMKYYPDGDLTSMRDAIVDDHDLQERTFMQMIDCVAELHRANTFHRDIKPQNFLRDSDRIVVADFGLSMELDSKTAFTRSSVFWGTQGFLPPEFHHGGFKHADAAGDVFMLGKTFYVLLTGRDPLYLVADDVPPPIFVIIERCCATNKTARYQDLSALKQSLTAAYDVLLGRVRGPGKVVAALSTIRDRLKKDGHYVSEEIRGFVEQLTLLDWEQQVQMCFELDAEFFRVLKEDPVQPSLGSFLKVYRQMVEEGDYAWSYAETIADHMGILFNSRAVSSADKTTALELAIIAAQRQTRFAAMGSCQAMIASVTDDDLAMRVRELILQYSDVSFVADTEASGCKHRAVRAVLEELQPAK